MKALIFIKTSNKTLKSEFRSEYPDVVTFYRTDTFWSRSLYRINAKVYSAKTINGETIVNGYDKIGFKKLFVDSYVSPLNRSFDIEYTGIDEEFYNGHIGESIIGYMLFNEFDIITKDTIPLSIVEMYHITCHSNGKVDVDDSTIINRDRNIEQLLK